jgi:hypothetical protein
MGAKELRKAEKLVDVRMLAMLATTREFVRRAS